MGRNKLTSSIIKTCENNGILSNFKYLVKINKEIVGLKFKALNKDQKIKAINKAINCNINIPIAHYPNKRIMPYKAKYNLTELDFTFLNTFYKLHKRLEFYQCPPISLCKGTDGKRLIVVEYNNKVTSNLSSLPVKVLDPIYNSLAVIINLDKIYFRVIKELSHDLSFKDPLFIIEQMSLESLKGRIIYNPSIDSYNGSKLSFSEKSFELSLDNRKLVAKTKRVVKLDGFLLENLINVMSSENNIYIRGENNFMRFLEKYKGAINEALNNTFLTIINNL